MRHNQIFPKQTGENISNNNSSTKRYDSIITTCKAFYMGSKSQTESKRPKRISNTGSNINMTLLTHSKTNLVTDYILVIQVHIQ